MRTPKCVVYFDYVVGVRDGRAAPLIMSVNVWKGRPTPTRLREYIARIERRSNTVIGKARIVSGDVIVVKYDINRDRR